jgi:hypothetical protein
MLAGGHSSRGELSGLELGRNIFPLKTAEQIKAQVETPYLVQNLLPARGVVAIFGESGSGKSFLAMDLVFAVASGASHWFGLKVKQRPVLYVALEGQGGLKRRITAWEAHYGRELTEHVRFQTGEFEIHDDHSVECLAEAALGTFGAGGVIVIDTLNQAAPGTDENNSADMGGIIAGAQKLANRTGGLVILIHHSGKDRSKGMRGHSSLIAAMDAVIEVARDGDDRSWRAAKVKDDDCGPPRRFKLKSHFVGRDEDGDELRSCAIEIDLSLPTPKLRPLVGSNRVACMEALKSAITAGATSLTWERAIEIAAAVLNLPAGRRKARAKETLESMLLSGHLRLESGLLCIAT